VSLERSKYLDIRRSIVIVPLPRGGNIKGMKALDNSTSAHVGRRSQAACGVGYKERRI